MHIRNLVKAGQSSHTISLPKNWLSQHKLKKGDSIYIRESGTGELVIAPKQFKTEKPKREIVLQINSKDPSTIQREITSAYINNYNKIVLMGDNTSKVKEIRDIIHNFIALEIAEQDHNKIVAKDLLNLKEVSIEKTISRMDIIIRSILKDAPEIQSNTNLFDSVKFRDQDVDRLYFMMFRILKSTLRDSSLLSEFKIDAHEVLSYWYLILNLESISDASLSICRQLTNKFKHDKKSLQELHSSVFASYKKVMKAYYNKDIALAQEVAGSYMAFISRCDEFFKSNKTFDVSSVLHSYRELYGLICNIARIVIDNDKDD